MKIRTGILLVLLSGSVLGAQPEAARTSIKSPVNSANTQITSAIATASKASPATTSQAASRNNNKGQDLRLQNVEYSNTLASGYVSNAAERVEADTVCVFQQSSYTYSCR